MKLYCCIFLLPFLVSCSDSNNKNELRNSDNNSLVNSKESSKNCITILSNTYNLKINNENYKLESFDELKLKLRNNLDKINKDTLFINYGKGAQNNEKGPIYRLLNDLKITKFQFVVTDEFFSLPY